MTRMVSVVGKAALALVLLAALGEKAWAQPVTGGIDRFTYVSSRIDARTTSTVLVAMPGMALDVPLRHVDAVLIAFCGKVSPADIVLVEARVDGVAAQPGQIVLDAEANTEIPVYEQHCFNFVAPDLGVGRHRVQMFYRSLGGVEISIQERSLTAFFSAH
jgi:hypothetical protein